MGSGAPQGSHPDNETDLSVTEWRRLGLARLEMCSKCGILNLRPSQIDQSSGQTAYKCHIPKAYIRLLVCCSANLQAF